MESFLTDKLTGLTDDLLDDIEGIDQGFEAPKADLIDDTEDDWILDSDLDYTEQLAMYRKHKN